MTWLNITQEQQLYDSLDIDIIRTYNESPNGYSRNSTTWSFLSSSVAANQRKLNTAAPEISTGSVNVYALIKFTSPIARSIGKSEIKTICGDGSWLIINESATSDVPLIDIASFDFAQYFYYVTISFAYVVDVLFNNGGAILSSPLSITYLDSNRNALWSASGIERYSIGYDTTENLTQGVSNFVSATSGYVSSSNTLNAESSMSFSFNLGYLIQQAPNSSGSKYIGFLFDASVIPASGTNYRWVIDKVQFEIKRIKK